MKLKKDSNDIIAMDNKSGYTCKQIGGYHLFKRLQVLS